MSMNTAQNTIEQTVSAPDSFLSGAFGYPCRTAQLPLDIESLALELAQTPAPAFMWIKVPDRTDPAFSALEDLGFRVAIEEISYERPKGLPVPPARTTDDYAIRTVPLADAARHAQLAGQIGALAADNLTTSRFHQDPLISDATAGRVKQRWAMNFFAGQRGQQMIVAITPDGRVVGFNQVLAGPTHKVIDLICTADDFRRRGVARALVTAMFEDGKTTRVGSQANNTAADAFYRSLGFQPVATSLCLHWHAPLPSEKANP
jgi:ribosomal protein S18 acetylase RimI-like enzyme